MPPSGRNHPVQLGRNRLGCGAHHQSHCAICCVDYTFMEELDSDEDVEEESGEDFDDPSLSNSDSRTPFRPPSPNDTPHSLFHETPLAGRWGPRFTRVSNQREMLIFTDGSCLNNGREAPRAGCAFVYCPGSTLNPGFAAFRLESQGPTGAVHTQTSNRAELRAVIAALQFRLWYGEGYNRVVIATDSEYVVKGITERVAGWTRKGWMTNQRTPVKNRDLWELLLAEVRKCHRDGSEMPSSTWLPASRNVRYPLNVEVFFWHIPRALNAQADRLAKEAATKEESQGMGLVIGEPFA